MINILSDFPCRAQPLGAGVCLQFWSHTCGHFAISASTERVTGEGDFYNNWTERVG